MVCAMLNLRLLVGVAGASSSGEMQPAARFVSWNQCGSQAANLGTEHATAYECAAAAWDNAACGSAIMFSPEMNAHWGCRCCRGNGRGGVAHKRWQLHRAVNAHKWWHRAVNASSYGRQFRKSASGSGNSGKRRYTGSIPEAEIYRKRMHTRVCHDVTFASPASCSDWSSRRSGI